VGFAGVAPVAAWLRLGGSGVGELVTLVAAICWGSYLALSAPLLTRLSPLRLTTWAILFGTIVMVLPVGVQLAVAGGAWATPETLAAIAYSGILAGGLANVLIFRRSPSL
jgi:drug/metabolite transporter (DMT)-like permease